MYQYVDANQLSPRVSLTWKPNDGTTFHAGYARNFTPPQQVIAAPTNLALVTPPAVPANTQTPEVALEQSGAAGTISRVRCRRRAEDLSRARPRSRRRWLLQARARPARRRPVRRGLCAERLQLRPRGENLGLELKSTYTNGNFRAYGNVAWAKQIATNIVSNQFLFGPDELAYIATHYIYTDHAQILTASAGASYLWNGTRFSASMIYGSGTSFRLCQH